MMGFGKSLHSNWIIWNWRFGVRILQSSVLEGPKLKTDTPLGQRQAAGVLVSAASIFCSVWLSKMLFVPCSESETSLPRSTQIYNSGQRFQQIQISSVWSPPVSVLSETKTEQNSLTSEPWVTGLRADKELTALGIMSGIALELPMAFIYQSLFNLR